MTTRPAPDQDLEDLLDAYVAEEGTPSHVGLSRWTHRYPHYAAELTDFTASWSVSAELTRATLVDQEERLVQKGMQALQTILRREAGTHAQAPVASLLEEGRARGISVQSLAEHAGISVPLVLKLDRRLIDIKSIPAEVVEKVAQALGREMGAIMAYLQRAPRFSAGVSYRADEAPSLSSQRETFFDAVRNDLYLEARHSVAWLLSLQAAGWGWTGQRIKKSAGVSYTLSVR